MCKKYCGNDKVLIIYLLETSSKVSTTNDAGLFNVLIVPGQDEIKIDAKSYNQEVVEIDKTDLLEIVLNKSRENIFFKIGKLIYNFFNGQLKTGE